MKNIKYLSTCRRLPTSAPIGHPHIVDLESVEMDSLFLQKGFGIADIVVTVLFKHKPETLARFLDLTHDFKFEQRQKDGDLCDFCIIRKGTDVKCGFVIQHPRRFWDHINVYRIEDDATGYWIPVSSELYLGYGKMMGEKSLYQGTISAKFFTGRRVWEEHESVDIVVEDSADL